MKISIYPIVSDLHEEKEINVETQNLLSQISKLGQYDFTICKIDDFYKGDLSLILVQSGGSEGKFLEIEEKLKSPYYLLTYGSNNSLAASMEILSYLKNKNKKAEILHGTATYIAKRLNEILDFKDIQPDRLGVVGKPSDWLIASNVDKDLSLSKLNIQLLDIEISELIQIYNDLDDLDYHPKVLLDFNQFEVNKAKKVSMALRKLIEKYDLKGLTLRCFDLLDTIHTTGCLGLSLLNQKGLVGTCEGDVPAMLSMYLLNKIIGQMGFQANPSSIDVESSEIIFAHCTVPYNMVKDIKTMAHYESGIGLAIRGKMKETDVTIFKLSANLKDYFVSEGKIVENLEKNDLCRTQVRIKTDDLLYYLRAPYGNHHIIIYGHHKQAIKDYLTKYL